MLSLSLTSVSIGDIETPADLGLLVIDPDNAEWLLPGHNAQATARAEWAATSSPDGGVGFVLTAAFPKFWTALETFWQRQAMQQEDPTDPDGFNLDNGFVGEGVLAWAGPAGYALAFMDPECDTALFEQAIDFVETTTALTRGKDFWTLLDLAHWPQYILNAPAFKAAQQAYWPNDAITAWQALCPSEQVFPT